MLALACAATISAQRGAAPGPPRAPKDAAPIDLTGYWVSLVTEDWRWRMVTPLKGDSASIPVNAAAKKLMNDYFAVEESELKLQRTYAAKLEKALPAAKAARYLQIENKIRSAIKYDLAANIPGAKQPQCSRNAAHYPRSIRRESSTFRVCQEGRASARPFELPLTSGFSR